MKKLVLFFLFSFVFCVSSHAQNNIEQIPYDIQFSSNGSGHYSDLAVDITWTKSGSVLNVEMIKKSDNDYLDQAGFDIYTTPSYADNSLLDYVTWTYDGVNDTYSASFYVGEYPCNLYFLIMVASPNYNNGSSNIIYFPACPRSTLH